MFDWITQIVVSDYGYWGIVLLMLGENIFPPIPSELIMPLAGFVAAQGKLNPVLVVSGPHALARRRARCGGTDAGRRRGQERMCAVAARHGRWLTLDDQDVGKAIRWFERHGRMAVLLGRLLPTVRTLVSVPAGMARMPLTPFLLYTSHRVAPVDRGARRRRLPARGQLPAWSATTSTRRPRSSSA